MFKIPFKKISDFYPFFALVVLSVALTILASIVKHPFIQNILSNMAATSIYALLALFSYDVVKHISDREKNRELRDYAESQVDPHIMSILILVSRLIYKKEENPGTNMRIKALTTLSRSSISVMMQSKDFMGFEIFRNSSETTKNIRRLLENSFIRPLLDDELALLLLKLTNRLENLYRNLSKVENLNKLEKSANGKYKIFGSREISSYNAYYPNRKLLVKRIPRRQGMGVVEEFADFEPNVEINDLLYYYKLKDEGVEKIAKIVKEIIELLLNWISKR